MAKRISWIVRILASAFAVIAVAISIVGCGGDDADSPSSEAPQEEAGSSVSIAVECEKNFLFSTYDISVFVDGESQGSLDHGSTKTFEMVLYDGSHEIRFANEGDSDVDGSAEFTVDGDTELKYKVKCTSSQIEVEGIGDVFPPVSSSDVLSQYHDEVHRAFEEAGFTNIREDEVRDLSLEQKDRNWLTGNVTIGGQGEFAREDAFLVDDEVVITYHVLSDLRPPASSAELEGKNCEEVQKLFEDAGFINVTTSATGASGDAGAVSSVRIGGIFGSSSFSADETFPFDSGVDIVFYEGVSTAEEPAEPPVEGVPEADLNALLMSSDTDAAWFSSEHYGKTITFNGWVASMMNHDGYSTRWDVLILAGDNGASPATGPNFRLTNVNIYDMNVTNSDSLREGDNITIVATVGKYDSTKDWLELDPVSISIR